MNLSLTSVVALAVTTSLAFANGGEGEKKKNPYSLKNSGWTPGSGITVVDDDAMSMTIGGRIQPRYRYIDYNQPLEVAPYNLNDLSTFDVLRARVQFSGHVVNEHLTYLLQLEATSNDDNVKDAWAHWNFWNNEGNHIGVRLGQGKSYFGLEATGSSADLWFTDRSLVTRFLSRFRSTGAILTGHHMENKLRWSAGLQNGDVAGSTINLDPIGDSALNDDTELNFVGHINFDPLGDMMNGGSNLNFRQGDLAHNGEVKGTVGLAYSMANNTFDPDGENYAVDSTSVNVNTAWRFGNGWSAQAEFFGRNDEARNDSNNSEDNDGYYAQVGYSLAHNPDAMVQWGFGARFSMLDMGGNDSGGPTIFLRSTGGDTFLSAGTYNEISLVATAFMMGHNAKTQFQYSLTDFDTDDNSTPKLDSDSITVLFTLVF